MDKDLNVEFIFDLEEVKKSSYLIYKTYIRNLLDIEKDRGSSLYVDYKLSLFPDLTNKSDTYLFQIKN